jgi:23S rRNA pseudouridine2605 synthase
MPTERLQKVLARAGIASRRAAETLIVEGRVRVNGKVVRELGAKADPFKDKIEVDGKRATAEEAVYLVLHKPRGVVSTMSDPEGRLTVRDLLKDAGGRIYPIGRLDFATSGVLLATNDGEFAEALMHPRREVPKTYVVKVSGAMTDKDVDLWRTGVTLEDGKTLPAKVKLLRHEGDKTWIELTIREGRNQQIRRMGETTGFPVMRLARTSFAGVTSDDLRPGMWRSLTRDELTMLKKEYGVPKRMPHASEAGGTLMASTRRVRTPRARPDTHAAHGAGEGRATPRHTAPAGKESGPRYGGGAPGRRTYDVREDWGGGAGRGRTHHDADADAGTGSDARGELGRGGGRGGATRTTGTGGGIRGSSDGGYRISRTRRGR